MTNGIIDELKAESAAGAKDSRTRRILILLLVLWMITLAALIGVGWRAYFQEKSRTNTLAQQIDLACLNGEFGEGFSAEDQKALCDNAEEVLKKDGNVQTGEIQEPEIQEPEIQDAENQESEKQDPEIQDPESQDPEVDEAETQEDEIQDPEVDDPEIQDPEVDDPEIQDPEVDDPDPASPYKFTFTFTVPGADGAPGYIYTVTCDSGTGVCEVTGG